MCRACTISALRIADQWHLQPLKMRGVGNNRLLVLVDGVPQNDNFNNAIAWVAWGHIPKHVIKRIEIVRGPASALYGSESLGGVVHIITKNPTREPKALIDVQAGKADTFGGTASYSQTVNDLGFLIAGGYETSNGFSWQILPQPMRSSDTGMQEKFWAR